jgi:peptidoglycan hydrolase FlgJ
MDILPALATGSSPASKPASTEAALRQKSVELEATFLAEMLQFAGLDAKGDGFDGGIGEEQFSSFLRQEQATLMAERGGIGLAESLFKALVDRSAVSGTMP